jgi:thiamine-phosphate pyrophosphorylase
VDLGRSLRRHYPVQVQTVGGPLPPSQPTGRAPVTPFTILPPLSIDPIYEQRRRRLAAARLYFVCEALPAGNDPSALLEAALRGGVEVIQLREKAPRCAEELISFAEPFARAARQHGALFILNDRSDLVEACRADGVHVGQEDESVAEARERAGPAAVVGLSTHSAEQVEAARAAGGGRRADQISIGPVWETPTKEGRPATGLGLIERAAAGPDDPPWFAIGGIDAGNVSRVIEAGARRIVVVRAIRDAPDPEAAARELRAALPD